MLLNEYLIAANARTGQHDNESYVAIAGGHHSGDDRAFAMSDQANFVGINFRVTLQKGDTRFSICSEIGRGGQGEAAGGLAETAVVGTQHRYSPAGQIVGQNEKRLVTENGFVAVLRA